MRRSYQDLHGLSFCFDFRRISLFATMDFSIFKDGRIHFRNSGLKELSNTASVRWTMMTIWCSGIFHWCWYRLAAIKISPLRKHAYSNIQKNLPPRNENFQIKNSDMFHISAQNIDRRGGSNEYPQSMFLSRNEKNNVYPFKPQFYYIKVGLKGVKII